MSFCRYAVVFSLVKFFCTVLNMLFVDASASTPEPREKDVLFLLLLGVQYLMSGVGCRNKRKKIKMEYQVERKAVACVKITCLGFQ